MRNGEAVELVRIVQSYWPRIRWNDRAEVYWAEELARTRVTFDVAKPRLQALLRDTDALPSMKTVLEAITDQRSGQIVIPEVGAEDPGLPELEAPAEEQAAGRERVREIIAGLVEALQEKRPPPPGTILGRGRVRVSPRGRYVQLTSTGDEEWEATWGAVVEQQFGKGPEKAPGVPVTPCPLCQGGRVHNTECEQIAAVWAQEMRTRHEQRLRSAAKARAKARAITEGVDHVR